ncbi:MAG: hypothetical protein GWP06_01620 [Actinobacteria bacterium]|nr:hypothetical protein [Actinomycetota bacterium]
MKISKNVTFVNLFAFILIFITSCVPPTTLAPRRDVLSFNSIQLYGLTENDLKNVQFFLDKELVIIGETTSLQRDVTKFHELKFYEHHMYDQVTFPQDVPGILVRTHLDGNLLQRFLNREVLKLDITFDREKYDESKPDTTRFLTFTPNASGGYELETLNSGRSVHYNNKQYQCLSGCSANALMVDAESLKREILKNRIAPGNILP